MSVTALKLSLSVNGAGEEETESLHKKKTEPRRRTLEEQRNVPPKVQVINPLERKRRQFFSDNWQRGNLVSLKSSKIGGLPAEREAL